MGIVVDGAQCLGHRISSIVLAIDMAEKDGLRCDSLPNAVISDGIVLLLQRRRWQSAVVNHALVVSQ